MRKLIALTALGVFAAAAQAELVTNGGFETGDFSGWTQHGDTGATSVWLSNSHGGSYNAYFGPVNSFGGIYQVLSANPGDQLHLSFWLLSENGGTPNQMFVELDGQTVVSLVDYTNTGWVEYTADVTVANANPELRFSFYNPPDYFDLDDVSVTVPEPGMAGLLALGALMLRRR